MMTKIAPVVPGILPAVSIELPQLRPWVDQMAELCRPDEVVWCDGSQEEYDRLCELLVHRGFSGGSTPKNDRTATWLFRTRVTWPESRIEHSSVAGAGTTRDRLTTGLIPLP